MRAPAAKANGLNSVPGTHKVGETQLPKVMLWPIHVFPGTRGMCTHVTNTWNKRVKYVHICLAIPPFKANSFTSFFCSAWKQIRLVELLARCPHAHCAHAIFPYSMTMLSSTSWNQLLPSCFSGAQQERQQGQLSTLQHQAAPVWILTSSSEYP